MFITNKHMLRRTFLRGMGATVALPLLDAMIPARTAAATAKPSPRLAFVYFPHGAVMNEWTPTAEGREFALGRILEPLAPFKPRLTVVTGLDNRHAHGPVHAITPGTWLTGASPRSVNAASPGTTIDQMAAEQLGRGAPLPSIELAAEPPKAIGAAAWEGDFAPSLGTTISFRTATQPLPMEHSPQRQFDRLFRSATPTPSARSSVLDLVMADAESLQQQLGPADRVLLRAYLDQVREIEQRADAAQAQSREAQAPGATLAARKALMFDLAALAFEADIARVASFMMAAETSEARYEHIGVPDSFHELSHHGNDPAKLDKLARIQRCHTQLLAQFVRKLAETTDGDGSLLDHSLILYGSNMSDSYTHNHTSLPLAVIGGGCGRLRGGQHVRYSAGTPLSNLLFTALERSGLPVTCVGDSTGECAEV